MTASATKKKRVPWLWWSAALVVALVLAGILLLRRSNSVDKLAPKTGPVVESIYGLGTVKSARDFEIKLGVSGRIAALHVREGQPVKRGEAMIRFDDAGVVRAPFDGVVTSLPYHVEDTVFAQQPVLKLEDVARRFVEVSVEQRGALRIRPGQPVRLVFESIRNERFEGRVTQVYPRSGDFIARIDASRLPPEVLPGMTADVAIEVSRTENALLIPASAVTMGRVLRERGGRREKVEVRLGAMDGSWAEVLEGDLKQDDLLVVRRQGARP